MFTKLVRIGRDAEMKYLPSGTAILEMSAVYDVGFGDKKTAQWVKLAMFGARAEKLVTHFTKGTQIVATMDDVKADAWLSNGEAKGGLSAKLVEFEFAGGQAPSQGAQQHQQQQQQQYQQAPQMQQAPQQVQSFGIPPKNHQQPQQQPVQYAQPQQMDDNIPF